MRATWCFSVAVACSLLAAPASATTYCVPSGGAGCDAVYPTIQTAVDASSSGDTVRVRPGSFGSAIIYHPIKLLGAKAGIDACRRDGTGESVATTIRFFSGADHSTLDGFTLQRSRLAGVANVVVRNNRFADSTLHALQVADGTHDALIQRNSFSTNTLFVDAVQFVASSPFERVRILDNCFISCRWGVVTLEVLDDGEIAGNRFEAGVIGGLNLFGGFRNGTIHDNVFTGNERGIEGAPVRSEIVRNSIDATDLAILLHPVNVNGGPTVYPYGNFIRANCLRAGLSAIGLSGLGWAVILPFADGIHDNNIAAGVGTGIGINNTTGVEVDATNNWWGAADGPSGQGSGSGAIVSINAVFEPFRTEPAPDTPCSPLLVVLESFDVTVSPRGRSIRWKTTAEIDTVGFRVWRADETGHERPVGPRALVPARGSELVGAEYELLDAERLPPGRYTYRLEDIDLSGISTHHEPVTVAIPAHRVGR